MAADLRRFVTAQDDHATFARALDELRGGRKRTHWMWFVFPQVAGLGRSTPARQFAIAGLDEAREYLAHPVLGRRLLECAGVMASLPGDDPVAVLGEVDAMKLRSSMTLFARAATSEQDRTVFEAVLLKYFSGAEDPETVRRL